MWKKGGVFTRVEEKKKKEKEEEGRRRGAEEAKEALAANTGYCRCNNTVF